MAHWFNEVCVSYHIFNARSEQKYQSRSGQRLFGIK